MAKKTASSQTLAEKLHPSQNNYQIYLILAIFCVCATVLMAIKFYAGKTTWSEHITTSQEKLLNIPIQSAEKEAEIIATTVVRFPEKNVLISQPDQLQNYIMALHKDAGRYVIILDPAKKILAHSNPDQVGKQYELDKNDEVGQAINTGKTTYFVEDSKEVTRGMYQVVIPLKDDQKTWGVLILSAVDSR